MTGSLTADHFTEFFRELHRKDDHDKAPNDKALDGKDLEEKPPEPFPWQRRLVNRVAETGVWPELLDLPTGSGKTAALDAAVFLLALREDQPRRMVFVVDRRIVVHQAAQRAEHIAERLRDARDGVLFEVAQRLRRLAGFDSDQPPLEYAELRGGIVRDNDWARRPDVPTVIVSTVDQVGSRLLFRGYGVSNGMRPVHAGLLGNDVLYLLDEVHLARPFAETLGAIHRHYRPPKAVRLPDRFSVVELSATPSRNVPEDRVLRLGDEDVATPVLARRLGASKPTQLRLVKVSGSDQVKHRQALASMAASEAEALLTRSGVRTVGVVVNRVDTAVRVHRLLDDQKIDAVLLTGRMRPLDRDVLLKRYRKRLYTGRTREDSAKPLVLVATQAIEAGADIDLDALVTECAPLDALIQRFGRVDRTGDVTADGQPANSVILATSADITATADDPVYGDRLRLTWEWLQGHPLDFGIKTFTIDPKIRKELSSEPESAPYPMPIHLDCWVQTSAIPDADPDPAHWLHGVHSRSPEVNVVWRADVLPEALSGPDADQRLESLVAFCPPGSSEAMSLPLHAVCAWLAGLHSGDGAAPSFSDTTLDGAAGTESSVDFAPALSWQGDNSVVVTNSDAVRAGSTLVVPATYGGIRADNWDPTALGEVSDLGTAVQANQRARAVLRLHPALTVAVPVPEPNMHELDRETVTNWLDEMVGQINGSDPRLPEVMEILRKVKTVKVDRVEIAPTRQDGEEPVQMFIVRSPRRILELNPRHESVGADSEPSTSSFLGAEVFLDQHLLDVECWAQRLAEACDLPTPIAEDLALAGRLHDLGKVDQRFQLILSGGEVIERSEPLAKSVVPAADYRRRRRAEAAAGYPPRARHELATVALVEHDRQLQNQAHDWDLVLHLIASHHGYARPSVPVSFDHKPQQLRAKFDGRVLEACSDHGLLRLDKGVPQRFWRCVRKYGWYGLAWLEAVLRLADHRASEAREVGEAGEERAR
ncbi:MAG: type I-G CRISPR-associated helicase/endonuclease Cas3g [Pseudonocardiaceae bacterium]